jgi:nucleoid DNA-binding protein
MMDRDLDELFGVATKVLKQSVKRNIRRFPSDFMFELTNEEFQHWRSQFVTSNSDLMGFAMAIKYRPVKKVNPAKRVEEQLFYPCPVSNKKVDIRRLAKEIAATTAFKTPDTIGVLEALTLAIPKFLSEGAIVSLGDFGTFRVTLKGKGKATKKEVTHHDIKGI